MQTYRIAVVAGDGIGPEVVASGIAIMDASAALSGEFVLEYAPAPRALGATSTAGRIFPPHHWRSATVPTQSCWAPAACLTSGDLTEPS